MRVSKKNSSEFGIRVYKWLLIGVILLTNSSGLFSQGKEMNYPLRKEVKWFTDARFGMFIHWTPLGAIDQEIGWSWGRQVSAEKYMRLCKAWNPARFDAPEWVRIAKNAGMKYHTKNFWFDGFWHAQWYGNPKYRTELYAFIKSLDASILMSRLQMPSTPEGGKWDDGWDFKNNVGDYNSREDHGGKEWENLIYKGPWEFCSSVAYPNYSYNSKMKYKTGKEMIQTLVKIAGRNGNYLLDMAPGPDGDIEESQKKLFSEIGRWMKIYGESVYGTEGGPYLPIPGDFPSTRKNNKIFLHLLHGQTSIALPAFENKIVSVKLFGASVKIAFKREHNKFYFSVPDNYKNENDVIIELVIKGSATDMALISPLVD